MSNRNLIKKFNLTKVDIIMLFLIFILLIFLILLKFNHTVRLQVFYFNYHHNLLEDKVSAGSYFDENHPNCYLTKESQSNLKSCKNNNGFWSYRYKTCFCQITQAI